MINLIGKLTFSYIAYKTSDQMSPPPETDWDRLTKSIKKIVGPTMLFISLPYYDFRIE